jgi:hypothetical protein
MSVSLQHPPIDYWRALRRASGDALRFIRKFPLGVWSGSPADYSQFSIFTYIAYAYVCNEKLGPRIGKFVELRHKF